MKERERKKKKKMTQSPSTLDSNVYDIDLANTASTISENNTSTGINNMFLFFQVSYPDILRCCLKFTIVKL